MQLKASRTAVINVPNLERFVDEIQKRLPDLDFEGKRLALDMLDITTYIDGENIEITGTIDTSIVTTPSGAHKHNTTIPFSLKISAGLLK